MYKRQIFSKTRLDPTIINGGVLNSLKNSAKLGKSDWCILEADESDGSLVKFNPSIGLITNLELEHVDHYLDLEDLIETMKQFAQNCECLITNFDCDNLRANIQSSKWFSIQFNVRELLLIV